MPLHHNITQSEPDVVELSSDEELITPLTNRPPTPRERSSSPDTQCPICLGGLINRCYTNSCLHFFCFVCLKRWSNCKPSCPLCKQIFNIIFHSFDDKGDHQIYNVPTRRSSDVISPTVATFPIVDTSGNLYMDIIQRHEMMTTNMDHLASLFGPYYNYISFNHSDVIDPSQSSIDISGQALRVLAYTHDAWAIPLPDIFSTRITECNLAYFRNNPDDTHRIRPFIVRDLIAIKEIARILGHRHMFQLLDSNISTLCNMIVGALVTYDMREGFMVNLLRPFLQWQALHFCHEFFNFASGPYDIPCYDRYVRFSIRPRTGSSPPPLPPINREELSNMLSAFSPPTPSLLAVPQGNPIQRVFGDIIVVDSDNEGSLPRLEVIMVNSSCDDSDIEIVSHSVRPTESLDFASIDQPSTSTGIRDSLDRPNNYSYRYNLKRRRSYKRFNEDSSSSDED